MMHRYSWYVLLISGVASLVTAFCLVKDASATATLYERIKGGHAPPGPSPKRTFGAINV
jgi:hypothetical protein